MTADRYGTTADYHRALVALDREGIHRSHLDLLRAHFAAPDHTVTWRQLAQVVGYPTYSAVNLQYGTFARRFAHKLGIFRRPRGFWLYVLADWADSRGARGETAFKMRPALVSALRRCGWLEGAPPASLLETDDWALEGRPQLRLVAHRHREAALRVRKLQQAREQSPDGKLRCSVPGCGFCFEDIYGKAAHDYIQVHHLVPLGRRSQAQRTLLTDLALVCANCHAMIHYLYPSRTLSRLITRTSSSRETPNPAMETDAKIRRGSSLKR